MRADTARLHMGTALERTRGSSKTASERITVDIYT